MRPLRDHLLPLAILLTLPILLLFPALIPGHALLPAAMLGKMLPWQGTAPFPRNPPFNPLLFDGIAQFYPWRLFAARTWLSGYVPLWNPYQFCGTPFLANDQSATLYPLNLIFLLLPVARAFSASAILHLFLTGAFLYAFLRRRLTLLPALLGAVTWQLSDWQVSWLALPTFLCTSTWIPLALLLLDRCAEAPRSIGRALALGACLGVMLLAGHLQIALYGLLLSAAYGLTLLVKQVPVRVERVRLALVFALAAIVMLLFAAPQLLPTIELSRVSHRAGIHTSMTGYTGYVNLAMPVYRLVTLFSPSFFGRATDYWDRPDIPYSETACFVGIATLLLGCIGACAAWAKDTAHSNARPARFFAVTAIVAMLFALGTQLNLLSYFGIPGFSQSGSPARVLVIWTLCAAILAAYGLEAATSRLTSLARAPLLLWAALLGLPLVGAILYIERQGPDYLRQIDRKDLLISLVIAAVAVALTVRLVKAVTSRERFVLAWAFILLAALDLFRAGYGFNSVATLDQVYPTTPALAFLQRETSGETSGAGRIVVLNAAEGVYEQPGVLPPNAATVYELRDLQGYDSLQTGQYKAYLNQLNGDHESSPLENGNMDLTHYQAAVSPEAASDADAEWIISPVALGATAPSQSDGELMVYRQFAPQSGRAWTIGEDTRTPAKILEDLPTRLSVEAQATGDVVVADQYYPGWQASAPDSSRVAIVEKPEVFRTMLSVKAGTRISLKYTPTSFLVGLYLACTALMTIGAALGHRLYAGFSRIPQYDEASAT